MLFLPLLLLLLLLLLVGTLLLLLLLLLRLLLLLPPLLLHGGGDGGVGGGPRPRPAHVLPHAGDGLVVDALCSSAAQYTWYREVPTSILVCFVTSSMAQTARRS